MPLVLLPKLLGRKLAELLLIFPFMIYDNGCCGRLSHLHLLSSFLVAYSSFRVLFFYRRPSLFFKRKAIILLSPEYAERHQIKHNIDVFGDRKELCAMKYI